MTRISFEATITPEGHAKPDDPHGLSSRLSKWEGKRVTISVEPLQRKHTDRQRAYYHGVIKPSVAKILSAGRDVPISPDQAHFVIKSAFLGTVDTPLGPVPKSTKDLSSAEYARLSDDVRAHYAAEGIHIPAPHEAEYE